MDQADQSKLDDETLSKIELLEKKMTKVIEKLHGYVTENCAKASVREKCSTLAFDLGTAKEK